MNYHILISFIPFGLILLLSLSLFALLAKFLKDKSFFLLLSVFLVAPLFIGLFLYSLLFLFPRHTNSFYILAISLPIFLLTFWERKNLFLAIRVIFDKWKTLKSQPLDLFSKILLSAILFISILVFLRTIFWPINWVDQICYLKQAYVFAQTHSLDLSLRWGFFHDAFISNYQMNPAIRPGLPMIFSTTFLFNSSLRDAQFFCQSIIFYYFLLTSAVVFYVNWKITKTEKLKSGLIALFLILSTFYFIYLSIAGFKELLIIPIAILLLFYISNQEEFLIKLKPWIYIGILSGLMSFVNYSGILISSFILLIFILNKKFSFQKIITAGKILLIAIIFSGFEFLVFFNFIAPNISQSFKIVAPNEQLTKPAITSAPQTRTNKTINDTKKDFLLSVIPSARNEFVGYGITSLRDFYIKGKFQGIFQIQYFGLIFILFTIIVITTYKKLAENRFIKNTLLFILTYAFVFFDPLNINHSEFAYVLSISHKYTTMLVPFVAIIIACQFSWIEKILKKISPFFLITALSSFLILDFAFFKNNSDRLFSIASSFVPILNNKDYYVRALELLNNLSSILAIVILIPLVYFYITKRKEMFFLFDKNSIVTILFLFIFFLSPFLFFYNSNFGLVKTFAYSFSKNATKLEKITGWEDMYLPLKSLNELPKNKKILFIDEPVGLIDIYLKIPLGNIYTTSNIAEPKNISAIKSAGISYVYAKNNSKLNDEDIIKINGLEQIKRIGENIIFKVKP